MIKKLIKRIKLPTPKSGKLLSVLGAVIGVGGGAAIVNEVSLTNDLVYDVIVLVAITVITMVSGSAQVPKELKDQLKKQE